MFMLARTDVLTSRAHEPPRNEERVLPPVQGARGPVERRVVVAAADRLVQRRYYVVVLVAASVVQHVRTLLNVCLSLLSNNFITLQLKTIRYRLHYYSQSLT